MRAGIRGFEHGVVLVSNGRNAAADKGDMEAVTRVLNSPARLHRQESPDRYRIALAAADSMIA
jgi:hypothetical protein